MRRRVAVPLALLLLLLFLLAVGPRAVAAELVAADPLPLLVGAFGSLAALVAWSEAQRRLHRGAGAAVALPRFLRGYLVGAFGKQVLPGGQIAGPAVLAFAIGQETDLAYEEDLAAVTVGKLLGTLAAVVPATVGLAVVTVPARVARPAITVLGVVVVGVLGGAVMLSAHPDHVTRLLRGVGAAIHVTVGRLSGRIRARTTPEAVTEAVARARRTLGVLGGDRRALAVAYALTVLGWVCYAVPLWGASVAVGIPLPLGVALFVAPVASLGSLVPLPAGIGGVELVLGGLLVVLTGASVATIAAVVLLYRVLVDVVPALVGALAGASALDR